jgi:hypothetical protein
MKNKESIKGLAHLRPERGTVCRIDFPWDYAVKEAGETGARQ